jgi:hypothetical protein
MLKSIFKSLFFNKRIINNFKSQIIFKITLIVINIIFPPVMIKIIGANDFGLWVLLLSISTFISLFNLDYDTYTTQKITILFFQKKIKLINIFFTNLCFLKIISLITYALIVFFLTLFFFADNNSNFFFGIIFNGQNFLIFIIICFCYALSIFQSIIFISINSLGDIYISTNIKIFQNILSKIFIIVSALIFKDLLIISICYLLALFISFLISLKFFFNLKINFFVKLNLISYKISKEVFTGSIQHYYENASQKIKHDLSNILIGNFIGISTVAYINTLKTLFYYFPIRIFDLLNNILYFEYSVLFTKKNFSKLFLLHNSQKKIVYLLLFCYLIFAILFGQSIYKIWIKDTFNIELKLIILILLDFALIQLFSTEQILLKSLNMIEKMAKIIFITHVISSVIFYIILNFNPILNIYFYLNILISFLSLFLAIIFNKKFFIKLNNNNL